MASFKRISFCILFVLGAITPLFGHEDDETLFLSRIADLYEENDLKLAEKHADEFLMLYPNSSYKDSVLLFKAEILLKRQHYSEALSTFSCIKDPSLNLKVKEGIGWTLYHAKQFENLEIFSKNELNASPLFYFFYAESQLRQGLSHFEKGHATEANACFAEAESYYQIVLKTDKRAAATLALGEIYRLTNQGQKALFLYESIAQDRSIVPVTARIHAALLIGKHDMIRSAELLKQLWLDESSHSDDAAIYWLETISKLKYFNEIHQERDALLHYLKDTKPVVFYYLAQAELALKNDGYQSIAESDLTFFVNQYPQILLSQNLSDKELGLKPFVLVGLSQLIDLSLLRLDFDTAEAWLKRFNKLAKSEQIAEKIVKFAAACRVQGEKEKSLKYAQLCIDRYKNCKEKTLQKLAFEASLEKIMNETFLSLSDYWNRESELLESYHGSAFYTKFLRFALATSDSHLKFATTKQQQEVHTHRIFILKQILKESLEQPELEIRKLELAHAYLFCGQIDAAKHILEEFKFNPPIEVSGQVFYLLALAFQNSVEDFTLYSEKALAAQLSAQESVSLHVKLFEIYFSQHKDEKAAEHLYLALKKYSTCSDSVLNRESLIWAARFYYERSKLLYEFSSERCDNHSQEAINRAVYIYTTLFKVADDKKIEIDQFLEEDRDLYYFAELLELEEDFSFSQFLFQQLVQLKERYPGKIFYSEGLADLHLARVLEKKSPEKSLQIYQKIIAQPFNQTITNPAKLAFYKLKYRKESASAIIDNFEMASIFDGLKALKINRQVVTEPCHLEAGFELVEYTADSSTAYDKRLFQLKHLKEEIINKNDLFAKDYHAVLEATPQKKLLYNAYLRLIDAAILECEAKLCQSAKERTSKANKAFALYSTLRQGKYSLNEYLTEKAYEGMKRIR